MSAEPPSTTKLALTEGASSPDGDTAGLTEEHVRMVVEEFYRRIRLDETLGPIFVHHVHDWDAHLARLTDFWSSALLHTGRFSGRPVESHRVIDRLGNDHFDRWLELFAKTVRDVSTAEHAEAFLIRAERMRAGMTRALGLD